MDNRANIVIGLTGPTGAGKSTAAKEFARQGCFVINCDQLAREVIQSSPACLQELGVEFGRDIFFDDGSLNRKLLASRAFASREKTGRLNAITHPRINERLQKEIRALQTKGAHTIVLDAPVLLESKADSFCTWVVVITAPVPVRLQRIMKRDHMDCAAAQARMRAQHPDDFYIAKAAACIDGGVEPDAVVQQVRQILQKIQEGDL